MEKFTATPTNKLRKGMIVMMYGVKFTVTEDARELQHRPGVYVAACAIAEPFDESSSDMFSVMNSYEKFQGNDIAQWDVID